MNGKKAICSVVATALVFAIAFSGVAVALQSSFSVAVNGGSARIQSSQRTSTMGGVPYDAHKYNLDIFAVRGAQFTASHSSDSANGVETETAATFLPAAPTNIAFLSEQVKRARVANSTNKSSCYSSLARANSVASALAYESAAITDDSNFAFSTRAAGIGNFAAQGYEEKMQGNRNGTWVNSVSREGFNVRGGMFNASAQFTSEVPEFPTGLAPEKSLCPFARP